MEHHIEEKLRLLQAEEGLKKDEMAGTTDRNEFRQSLDDPEKNGL